MKKGLFLSIVGTLTLSTLLMACGASLKTDESKTNSRRIRPASTPSNQNQTAQFALNQGINIDWLQTEVLDETNSGGTLSHTISLGWLTNINGSQQTQTTYKTYQRMTPYSRVDCRDAGALPYDTIYDSNQTGPVYHAIGYTSCVLGDQVYIGLSLMAWNQSYLTQQFVLMDLKSDVTSSISKSVRNLGQDLSLTNWVSSIFY